MSTSKITAPVVGFNHNLKHGGRVFHVQTEDSGLPRAHFITHLYIGGNILASMKGSYVDKLDDPEMLQLVRKMMEEQHKAMVRRLVAGEFKDASSQMPHYEPGVLASGKTSPGAVNSEGTAPADAAAVARASSPGLRGEGAAPLDPAAFAPPGEPSSEIVSPIVAAAPAPGPVAPPQPSSSNSLTGWDAADDAADADHDHDEFAYAHAAAERMAPAAASAALGLSQAVRARRW